MSTSINQTLGDNFFKRYLKRKLTSILPRRVKRMFYLGSLLNLFLGTDKPELSVVDQVNTKLDLANTSTGLLFPIYIGTKYWDSLKDVPIELSQNTFKPCQILLNETEDIDVWKVSLYLTRRCPDWMVYGSEELLTSDTHDLVKTLKELRPVLY